MIFRRILLAVSAIAVIVLGLERVGVYRLVPTGDTGFRIDSTGSSSRLQLSADAGELKCWIRIIVKSSTPPAWRVEGWEGDPIAVESIPLGGDRFELRISKSPVPPAMAAMTWGAGMPLTLVNPQGGSTTIEDWAVFPTAQESDTMAKARQRRRWTLLSLGLLVLSLAGAGITSWMEWGKKEEETVTTQTLVRAIIANIEGHGADNTKRVRLFLTRVLLEQTTVAEAVRHAMPEGSTPSQKLQFQVRAVVLFRNRIAIVQNSLSAYLDMLSR